MKRFKRYLSAEIGIEFKACLYFYVVLFFYCIYCILQGNWHASIPLMAEMIFTTYGMGYVQVFLMGNFDEAEQLDVAGVLKSILGTAMYTGISYLLQWFDRNPVATVCFFLYMLFAYIIVFLVYRVKRKIDTEQLNEELEYFKEQKVEEQKVEEQKNKE